MENNKYKYSSEIQTRMEKGILKITLNRPNKRNAISPSMYTQLTTILNESSTDDNVRMTVVTGAGKFFTSGNDMSLDIESTNFDDDIMNTSILKFTNFINALITYPKLLVAIVNGPAIGVGATMLGLFDMVYASDTAYFQTPFSSLGLIGEGCSTYTFPRIMGNSKAGDVLYMGKRMSVTEAEQCGFISKIYKTDSANEIWEYLLKVSTLSMESILATKCLVRKWKVDTLLEVNKAESEELLKLRNSSDFLNRVLQFVTRKNKL